MITDEELRQWKAMVSARVTLRTHEDRMADARRQKELATAAESAFPRLIAEVELLRAELLESRAHISLLTTEVGRLQKADKTW